jgi:hypothetical protein
LSELGFASILVQLGPDNVVLGEIDYEVQGGTAYGVLFVNNDGSGLADNNPRLSQVRVTLHRLADKTTVETRTDAQGAYSFDRLDSGYYRLSFEPVVDAAKRGLGEGRFALPDPLPGVFFLSPNELFEQDFGYVAQGGEVHGVVFLDENASGFWSGSEPGLVGVPVVLVDADKAMFREVVTTANGDYRFLNIPPGVYTLLFANEFPPPAGGEFTLTTPGTQTITVLAGQVVEAKPAGYQPDIHEIRGRVVFEDGSPVKGAVVTLVMEAGGVETEIDTAVTDKDGQYIFKNRQGPFKVKFPDLPFEGQLLTSRTRPVYVESVAEVPDTVYRLTAGEGAGGVPTSVQSVQDAFLDIASYMPTSQNVTGPGRSGVAGTNGAAPPLQQLVDGALAAVLGRNVKPGEPKAFLESLDRAFTLEEVDGHTEYKWTARTYAVQTELGGRISGAQASIYHRAKTALDDALPLLEGLQPLLASADQEEVEAERSIVRTELVELVNELGLDGGPRVQRVDDIFTVLLDHVDRLRDEGGFTTENVITMTEEERLTNYLVVRDYARGLFEAWKGFRNQFTGAEPKFLGTQLILLSRALASVADSVEETFSIADSVFLGPSERQAVRIDFPAILRVDNKEEPILKERDEQGRPVLPPSLLVEELLNWVRRFAAAEGPTLIQDGGRRGVEAIQPIAERLRRLVLGASQANVAHAGFNSTRVRRALIEMAAQLGQVARLAGEVLLKPPA